MNRLTAAVTRILLLCVLGAFVAITWIAAGGGRAVGAALTRANPLVVAGMLGITALWLTIRFLRWHYMMRRAGVRIPIRGSLAAYLAGLPGTATPAYLGEILRGVFIRRRYGIPLRVTTSVLIAERLMDVIALALILALAVGGRNYRVTAFIALGVLLGFIVFPSPPLRQGLQTRGASHRGRATFATVLVLSIALWTLAGSLVLLGAAAIGETVPLIVGLRVFSAATLGGALSLMPAGVGSAGSILIVQLRDYGQSLTDAIATTSLVRLSSVGAVLSVGFVFFMRELRWSRAAGASVALTHFDDIAEEYGNQFSEHVWEHLLRDKLAMIESALPGDPGEIGFLLDLGCGLGRQSTEMIRRGYKVTGIDSSPRLLRHAEAAHVPVAAADALRLPFADETFDLVYTIGVLHHLNDTQTQETACREVARVLKPGGRFLVHETNPRNPFFRFYMGYMFPLLKRIDEGTELWIHPRTWTRTRGFMLVDLRYFTFLPDFLPRVLMQPFLSLERRLEGSFLRSYSVHYLAVLEKTDSAAARPLLSGLSQSVAAQPAESAADIRGSRERNEAQTIASVEYMPGRLGVGEILPR